MKAMILAAGFGKRLGHLTQNTPKPLIQVKGKALIDYHLDKLIKSGFEMVVINLHYLGEQIEEHITSNFSGKIKIIFSHEKEILGTCGGILNAIDHFGNDDFLVLNADIFSDIDYVYFEKFKAPTIFAVKNDKNGDFSIKNEKVIVHGERNFTWTGFSIINSSFFQGMETKYSDYWKDLMIHLAAEEKVLADIPNINWYDVGIKDTLDFLNSE